jgi:Zn-dependent protease with chaperone function
MKDRGCFSQRSCATQIALMRLVALFLVMLLAAPQLLLAAVQPELPNPGSVSGVSRQDEVKLGLQAMSEVYKQMPVLPDSNPMTQYVQQLGNRMVSVIPQQYSWPYQFHVIPQKEINAFALPGGPIFINVGTITAADNEAELAGVMAHEMAHVYMQHSVKQMRKNVGPSILAGLGQIVGSMIGGVGGAIASMGGQIGGGLISMKYSRADEAQADAVGAIIMYKAGYNPKAMADFFQKLEKQGGSGGPSFMSDHPNPGNRYAAITNEIKDWPAKPWQQNSAQFQQAKSVAAKTRVYTAQQIAQGSKSGQWARQNQQTGSIPKNLPASQSSPSGSAEPGGAMSPVRVSASDNYKTLRHQAFTIDYPENWQPAGNQQSAVTIAPEGGVAGNAIAYGVMIDTAPPQNPNASLDQQTQDLIRTIQQQNPGIQVTGNPRNITVNGVHGRSVDLIGASPVQGGNGQPLQERDWLVTLPRPDGSLLYLVFIAPEPDFGRLRPAFEHMLRTLRLQGA